MAGPTRSRWALPNCSATFGASTLASACALPSPCIVNLSFAFTTPSCTGQPSCMPRMGPRRGTCRPDSSTCPSPLKSSVVRRRLTARCVQRLEPPETLAEIVCRGDIEMHVDALDQQWRALPDAQFHLSRLDLCAQLPVAHSGSARAPRARSPRCPSTRRVAAAPGSGLDGLGFGSSS